jgi:hypothetical protein
MKHTRFSNQPLKEVFGALIAEQSIVQNSATSLTEQLVLKLTALLRAGRVRNQLKSIFIRLAGVRHNKVPATDGVRI